MPEADEYTRQFDELARSYGMNGIPIIRLRLGFAPMEPLVMRAPGHYSVRRWRCRRRLRFLLVRPRSRELLDRAGLVTGIVYVKRFDW